MRAQDLCGACTHFRGVAVILVLGLLAGVAPPTAAAVSRVAFPIRAEVSGGIKLVPSGTALYVVVPVWSAPAGGKTAIAALDDGRLRPGWPVQFSGDCSLVPSDVDATVRVLCAQRAFALDRDGTTLPGWPVFIGGADTWSAGAVVTGGDLVALTHNGTGVRPVRVSPAGKVRSGVRLAVPESLRGPCTGCWVFTGPLGVGPDGTGYLVTYQVQETPWAGVVGTQLTTFDLTGVRPGWPVRLDPAASAPVFGAGGRIYVTQGTDGKAPTRIVVLDRAGHIIKGTTTRLPVALPTYGAFGEGPGYSVEAPMVAADGSTAVMPMSGDGIAAYRADASGRFRPGWTYRSAASVQEVPASQSFCSTPSWSDPTSPALAPDGSLYVLRQAANAKVGGSVIGIGRDGTVKAGWPVTLRDPDGEFWSVSTSSDGTVYLLAVEPEGRSSVPCAPYASFSGTVLAVRSDGVVRYRTTVVEP